MNKKYYEFDSENELTKHLTYWSNACGDLHHNGEYALNDASELPEELQRAYRELWREWHGCLEYLAEYDHKYYVALISEFDDSTEEFYNSIKKKSLELYQKDLFSDTMLVIGKRTGYCEHHEVIFLVQPTEDECVYRKIEDAIHECYCRIIGTEE